DTTVAGTFTGTDGITADIDIMAESPFLRVERLMEGVHEQIGKSTGLEPAASEKPGTRDLLKVYVSKNDSRFIQELRSASRNKLFFAIGVLLLVFGTVVVIEKTRKQEISVGMKDRTFQEYMGAALKAEKIGDYQ